MGVYIKGMDMPESCAECFVAADVCRLWEDFDNRTEERNSNCPLVEVKAPHGELIDRAELIKKAVVIYDHNNYERLVVSDGALADAPTIIEAKGKDNE